MLSLIAVILVLLVISGGGQAAAGHRRGPRQPLRLTDKQIQTLSLQVSKLTQKVISIERQVQSALHPSLPTKGTQSSQDDNTDLQTAYNNLTTQINSLSTAVTTIVSAYNTLQTSNTTLTTANASLQSQVTTLTAQNASLQALYNNCIAGH